MNRKPHSQLHTSATQDQADDRTQDEIEHQSGYGGSYSIDHKNGDGRAHLVHRTEQARVSHKHEGVVKHQPAPEQPASPDAAQEAGEQSGGLPVAD